MQSSILTNIVNIDIKERNKLTICTFNICSCDIENIYKSVMFIIINSSQTNQNVSTFSQHLFDISTILLHCIILNCTTYLYNVRLYC